MKEAFERVYHQLFAHYGEQHWWPAQSAFEVMVGAILTQNTAWSNVEKAIANLKSAQHLDPEKLDQVDVEQLALWIQPSGYFNVKAKRLKNFCRWYVEQGGFVSLNTWDTQTLRHAVLSVNGVGPETADDMLLYAFERPIFVVDAYTKRLFSRLGLLDADLTYHQVQDEFHRQLSPDVALFNEYHALIVIHCKDSCRVKPRCGHCVLANNCRRVGVLQQK